MKIFVINPGSTSTKIGLFEDRDALWTKTIRHSPEELKAFSTSWEQYPYRKGKILEAMREKGLDLSDIDAVVGRGGILKPMEFGTYVVNEAMVNDAREAKRGQHACNLGCIIARDIADMAKPETEAYVVDSGCVDELEELARFSGIPDLPRTSIFHALNGRAVAMKYAESHSTSIDKINLIIVHMGGGITVTALKKGRAVEINHGLYEGAFTPERCGFIASMPLLEYSRTVPFEDMKRLVIGGGGLSAYLGTSDAVEIEREIERGNDYFRKVYEAMAYQISQQIGGRAAVLCGDVQAIILTGGLAHSRDYLDKWISERCGFIAPIVIMPGEFEMEAMAAGALRVMTGEEKTKTY